MNKKTVILFLIVFFLAHLPVGIAFASVYYVSPRGNDKAPGTFSKPWRSFSRAMLSIKPGDTLYLKNGVYYQSLDIAVSGTTSKPVIFKALHDGMAIVDGQWTKRALRISNRSNLRIDGITFRHSGGGTNAHGLDISNSSHLVIYRVIADGSSGYNSAVISLCGVHDSLLEDCAGSGPGRVVLNLLDCSNVTVRRCWLDWSGPSTGGGDTSSISQVYDSSNILFENNIGVNLTRTPTDDFGIWAHYKNSAHNTFIGNIVYHTASYSVGGFRDNAEYGKHSSYDLFKNNVSILPISGAYHSVTADVIGTDHHTSINDTFVGDGDGTGFFVHERPNRASQVTTAVVKNCSFLNTGGGITASSSGENSIGEHKYNNFFKVRTCLWNQKQMVPPELDGTENCNNRAPGYDVERYGKGAYFLVPAALRGKGENGSDIGAQIVFRYKNGKLTGVPLWPWPMEGRILAEFGVSPTWEAKGGLWKTLSGIYQK